VNLRLNCPLCAAFSSRKRSFYHPFRPIPPAAIKPPNEALTGLSGEYLRGIAAAGDRMIVVLDIDAILDATDAVLTIAKPTLPSSQEIR